MPLPIEKKRKWTRNDLEKAVATSRSIRQVIGKLGLVEAGGNYEQVKKYMKLYGLEVKHFTGQGWGLGTKRPGRFYKTLEDILKKGTDFQSFKLKNRLFFAGLKKPECEMCAWSERSLDGRIPLELDHINGDRYDNTLENLRILCPNCHSLQSTHRGRNKKKG